jgi:hypothetical protein
MGTPLRTTFGRAASSFTSGLGRPLAVAVYCFVGFSEPRTDERGVCGYSVLEWTLPGCGPAKQKSWRNRKVAVLALIWYSVELNILSNCSEGYGARFKLR